MPLSAAFLGAAFWAGALGVGLAARQRFWPQARLVFAGATTFTLRILLTTLLHLDRFHLEAEDSQSFLFAVAWLIVYLGLPPVLLLALLDQRRARGGQPARAAVLATGPRRRGPDSRRAPCSWGSVLSGSAVCRVSVALAAHEAFGTSGGVGPVHPGALLAWDNDRSHFQPVAPVLLFGAVLEEIVLGRYVAEVNWTRPLAWISLGALVSLGVVGALETLARLSRAAAKVSQPGDRMNDRTSRV